ncbi:VOC family protein [Micromonospora sp. DT47]|uniref:VOC family protein n=1 Tax=Micromonospora sp. DT47 TaxID=3393431 RepID=UPI003CEF2993
MTSDIRNITFDSSDPYELAGFWAQVLGYGRAEDDVPFDPQASLVPRDDCHPKVFFFRAPDSKRTKNPIHLDVQPVDCTRDQEVERLLGLGAQLVADHRRPDGLGWVVLNDPEGNEFCVVRSASERA